MQFVNQKLKKKIDRLLEEMSLEQKAALCSGKTAWLTEDIEQLDLPSIRMADGPHGLRVVEKLALDSDQPATCFPTASALAASWDTDLVREVGAALGQESQALGVHILLGPGVNMKRTPRCGRNFEYFAEDPYLAGEMGVAFVRGVQSQGVGTSLKHFTANNQENRRFTINAEIDERTLREIYLPAFERVVKTAHPWTVMCAYNRINGTFASENDYLLSEILKKEWGFEGLVVSDWGAVDDRVRGIKAGLDLEMPGPSSVNDRRIVRAVESGELSESVLDGVVKRILRVVFKACNEEKQIEQLPLEENHRLARRAAANSCVLLKNEGDLLPLDFERINSLAVIGRMAEDPKFEGGGSSQVTPNRLDKPLAEIRKVAGTSTRISYLPGYPETDRIDGSLIEEAADLAETVDTVVVFAGLPHRIESEGYDRQHIRLPRNQIRLIQAITDRQSRVIVVLNNGSAVTMNDWIDEVPAVLEAWLGGQAVGGAIADIIGGRINPSGKLAETFPVRLEDNPAYLNYPGENDRVRYGEGLYIGYRYYDKKKIRPQFPFGHGLSYTDFDYSQLNIERGEMRERGLLAGEQITVSLTVENTGTRVGKEVVQLYVSQRHPRLSRPEKELKAFDKIKLVPGESRKVSFKLGYRDFAYYDPLREDWVVDTDEFKILVGASSADIRLEQTLKIEGERYREGVLDRFNTVRDWLEDAEGRAVIEEVLSGEQLEFLLDEDNAFITMKPLSRVGYSTDGFIEEEEIERIIYRYNK